MPPDGREDEGDASGNATLAEALGAAKLLHRSGRLDEAESLYEKILEEVPDHAGTIQYFGLLKHFKGQSDEALTLLRRALALAPEAPNLHNNLGRVLADTGRLAEAEAAYRAALALDGCHVEALVNLGALAETEERLDEAEAHYRRALEADLRHVPTQDRILALLFGRGRFVEAHTLAAQFIEALPREAAPLKQLVAMYTAIGETRKALAVVEEALEADPENPVMLHLKSALSGGDVPARASDRFVAQLFDEFAGRFDRTLSGLDYRAPDLVAAAVSDLVGEPRKALDILDAGCGTGLCGALLAPFARRLVGVDLSPKMIEKAGERTGYAELEVAELVRYLGDHPRGFDLVASADTLCYFGDLSEFSPAAAGALRPGGLLIFTVEEAESGETESFRLAAHGRYLHHRDYVLSCLRGAGFTTAGTSPAILRKEAGQPVRGLVVTAAMPA